MGDLDDLLFDMESHTQSLDVSDKDIRHEKLFLEPDHDLEEKIKSQVEFYFSDTNILKDAFLLKHVTRNKHGYVSLKLVTSFRKMKSLTKDYRVVAFCIKNSKHLQINEEGTKVKRIMPLPEFDDAMMSRTVIATNLPFLNPSIENVAEMFSKCGEITLIQVLKPGKPLSSGIRKHINDHPEMGHMVCAVVEFETHESAQRCCERSNVLLESSPGLSVTLLSKKTDKVKHQKDTKFKVLPEESGGDHGNSIVYDKYDKVNMFGDKSYSKQRYNNKNEKTHIKENIRSDGDKNQLSSDDEHIKKNIFRSSLSPSVTIHTPSETNLSPRQTPSSSPRNSPSINRRRLSHGKSPLTDSLSPGSSPHTSPCISPESSRRGIRSLESSPSPGCSPWLQRKFRAQQEGSISPLVGSPIGSPRIGRRLLNFEGVIRHPKGPDEGNGFYEGMGRGKMIINLDEN